MLENKQAIIYLTPDEIQSGFSRQRAAEGLIKQLPKDHDGRNTWLLNYGKGKEAQMFRDEHNHDCKWNYRCDAVIYKQRD